MVSSSYKSLVVATCTVLALGLASFASAQATGTVAGNINANDTLDIRRGASVEGEVTCARISIQDGAAFSGKVSMGVALLAAHGGAFLIAMWLLWWRDHASCRPTRAARRQARIRKTTAAAA